MLKTRKVIYTVFVYIMILYTFAVPDMKSFVALITCYSGSCQMLLV